MTPESPVRPTPAPSRYFVSIFGIALFCAVAVLYLFFQGPYIVLMKFMLRLPAPHPFTDWEWLPAAVTCWQEGVDVYINNSCYQPAQGLGFNYSPLWLRLGFLRYLDGWHVVTGIVISLAWLASLMALPVRNRFGRDMVLRALCSSAIFLAIERGNVDLLIFLMMIAALWLRGMSPPLRLFGYAIIIFAGLLKFYPFVALLVVLRERVRVVLAVAAASAACLLALVLAYHQELGWMARNLPVPSYFTLQFGAADLPMGLGASVGVIARDWLQQPPQLARALGGTVGGVLMPVLTLGALVGAVLLGRRLRMAGALGVLTRRELDFLVVGAALICGCFFAGQSVIYRGMFLLLVLPAIGALRQELPGPAARRVFAVSAVAMVLVLWAPAIESVLFLLRLVALSPYQGEAFASVPASPARYLLWLGGEIAWWWIVMLLLAVLGGFVFASPAWGWVRLRVRGRVFTP